ncbi:MAG: HAD-IA family hydrolase [Chloroflexota bacterium]
MTTQALILDVDGVLAEPLAFAKYLDQHHPEIASQTGEFFRGIFAECIVGRADLREVLPAYLEKWGWPSSLDDYLALWFETEKWVDERILTIVQTLRQNGIHCYVATNQEKHRLRYMRSEMKFDLLFDGVFGSAEIGYRKPDANFYQTIMHQLSLTGDKILFWDDTLENVTGARECGWQAEHYTSFSDFSQWIDQSEMFQALRKK